MAKDMVLIFQVDGNLSKGSEQVITFDQVKDDLTPVLVQSIMEQMRHLDFVVNGSNQAKFGSGLGNAKAAYYSTNQREMIFGAAK